jgi:hypothetical protein
LRGSVGASRAEASAGWSGSNRPVASSVFSVALIGSAALAAASGALVVVRFSNPSGLVGSEISSAVRALLRRPCKHVAVWQSIALTDHLSIGGPLDTLALKALIELLNVPFDCVHVLNLATLHLCPVLDL